MGVEPVPAELWKQAQLVPWVLHRVTSLMAALPFMQGWERKMLFIRMEDNRVEKEQMQFMISSNLDALSSPSTWQMVQTLFVNARK